MIQPTYRTQAVFVDRTCVMFCLQKYDEHLEQSWFDIDGGNVFDNQKSAEEYLLRLLNPQKTIDQQSVTHVDEYGQVLTRT